MPVEEREHLPLTEEVITAHLSGELQLGLYPLVDGKRSYWLAADFDGPTAFRYKGDADPAAPGGTSPPSTATSSPTTPAQRRSSPT